MDFCRSDEFGHRGRLFLAQWGTLAPPNTIRPEALKRELQVAVSRREERTLGAVHEES